VIDLLPDAEEAEIIGTIGRMLADTRPLERFRVAVNDQPKADADVVPALAELGAPSLGLPQAAGGLGLSHAVEAMAFREYGRVLVSPAILGAVIGARIAADNGDDALAARLVSGEARCGLGIAERAGQDGVLTGPLQFFECGRERLALVWTSEFAGLYDASGLDVRAARGLDETLTMEVAEASALAPRYVSHADRGATPLAATLYSAAMLSGMAEAVRDMASAYARVREQFGKPIGHFQAVKHKCADMALHAEAAWCETIYAALDLDVGGAGAAFHVLNAKMLAARTAIASAKENIQVHGGMGYTTEVPAHHFIKRARVLGEIGPTSRDIPRTILDLPVTN
jgi:alkylation response protein AidB-like acyl-CoA dehydrogenase